MLNWIKPQRKLKNKGELKAESGDVGKAVIFVGGEEEEESVRVSGD